MRPLRPLFHRNHNPNDLEREAERLKNRDWVEMLRVVHPSQAADAEREYMLARLSHDWSELASPLLATHSLPSSFSNGNLVVLCDHNTFANELSLIAPAVEKKIAARYGVAVRIKARASQRIDWRKRESPVKTDAELSSRQPEQQTMPVVDELIRRLSKIGSA